MTFSLMRRPPQSPDINPTDNFWEVIEKALHSGLTIPSSTQDLGEKLMQPWTEINVT